MERLTSKVHGVSPNFLDHLYDTLINAYKVDGQS